MSDKRDLISGLLLPVGQAATSGILVALAVVSCWKLSQGVTAWRLFGSALSVGGFIAWLFILRRWSTWIDSDHGITPPAPVEIINPVETIRVTLESQAAPYLALEWLDIPLNYDQLTGVCLDLQARNYDTANLGGAGRALTRAEAERFRDYLISHGLAEWLRPDSHVVGWRLGGAGRALVRRVCEIANNNTYPPARPGLAKNWRTLPAMQTHTDTQSQEGR